MPRIDTLPRVLPSLGQKAIGLTREFWGTILDNDSLREQGRAEQDEASHRLEEFRREMKANVDRAKAVAKEEHQRILQGKDDRSRGVTAADKSGPKSAASAAAEKVKGGLKEAAGSVAGNDRLRREGAVQQDKGEAQADVAREEAGAEKARLEAEQARARADAAKRS